MLLNDEMIDPFSTVAKIGKWVVFHWRARSRRSRESASWRSLALRSWFMHIWVLDCSARWGSNFEPVPDACISFSVLSLSYSTYQPSFLKPNHSPNHSIIRPQRRYMIWFNSQISVYARRSRSSFGWSPLPSIENLDQAPWNDKYLRL